MLHTYKFLGIRRYFILQLMHENFAQSIVTIEFLGSVGNSQQTLKLMPEFLQQEVFK